MVNAFEDEMPWAGSSEPPMMMGLEARARRFAIELHDEHTENDVRNLIRQFEQVSAEAALAERERCEAIVQAQVGRCEISCAVPYILAAIRARSATQGEGKSMGIGDDEGFIVGVNCAPEDQQFASAPQPPASPSQEGRMREALEALEAAMPFVRDASLKPNAYGSSACDAWYKIRTALSHEEMRETQVREMERVIESGDAKIRLLEEALEDHNQLLRSAFSAAQRDAIHETQGTTNYNLLADAVAKVLDKHHTITNTARYACQARRAALAHDGGKGEG